MRVAFLGFLFFLSSVFGEYSIVFVHIGRTIPDHTQVALKQARLFNPNATIILLSSKEGLKRFSSLKKQGIELWPYEDLPKSALHHEYDQRCAVNNFFWRVTSERFLYLWDLMEAYPFENVFHLENDNMLYANLEPFLPIFRKHYPGIGATFDSYNRCIPGFVWIPNRAAMNDLAKYFVEKAPQKKSDMDLISDYRRERSCEQLNSLPVIMPEFTAAYPIKGKSNTMNHPGIFTNLATEFHAIFDAAAIGQFLGGSRNTQKPGFVNWACLFNPSFLEYQWIRDEEGRFVPYAIYGDAKYNIVNLHIHSKQLAKFYSLNPSMN